MKLGIENKRQAKSAVCLSLAINFMLCLYAPTELYVLNMYDFWFDIYILIPVMFVVFLLGTFVLSVVLIVMSCFLKDKFSYVLAAFMGLYLAFYVQGNYLVSNLPVLDDDVPKWEHYDKDRAISLIVWLLLIAICIFLARKLKAELFEKFVLMGSIFITLMLLVTGFVLLFSQDGFKHKQKVIVTTDKQLEMSTDSNLIVLLVDSVDSRTFEEAFEEHPEYADYFEDFTYFSNTVSGYPYTVESIPFILSGEWYENETGFEEYLTEVYSEAALFERLEEQDYDMGLYSPYIAAVEDECVFRFSNMRDSSIGKIVDYPGFVSLMFQYVGYRYVPFQFKDEVFTVMVRNFTEFREIPEEYEQVIEHNNGMFYEAMQNENAISYTDKKVFKFIHLNGAHSPYEFDENMEKIDDGTYRDAVESTITMVHTYLELLKSANVYDNSAIVVMADHGYDISDEKFPRQNALLMVKGVGESKPFEDSQAPIAQEDMAQAFERLLGGNSSDAVFEWEEGDERKRRHFVFEYTDEEMEEYLIGTDSRDLNAVTITGRVYGR